MRSAWTAVGALGWVVAAYLFVTRPHVPAPAREAGQAGASGAQLQAFLETPPRPNKRFATDAPKTTPMPTEKQARPPRYGHVVSGPAEVASPQPPECPPIEGYRGQHAVHELVDGRAHRGSPGFDPRRPEPQPAILDHLLGLAPISKIAHITWKTEDIFTSDLPVAVQGVQALGRLNPKWQVVYYNDSEVSRFIKDHIPAADWELIKDKHIVAKGDLFRLLVVYFLGGFYQDIDRLYTIPFDTLIKPNTRLGLPTAGDQNFAQDIVLGAPCNEVHRTVIELNLGRRKVFADSPSDLGPGHEVFVLGPDTYFEGVGFALYGVKLPHGDKATVRALRDGLTATDGLILTKKEEWCDTFVQESKQEDMDKCKSVNRNPLYAAHNVQHWDAYLKANPKGAGR